MQTEVEHLRDSVKQLEHKLENRDLEDEEKWSKREEIWKAKLSEADIAIQAAESKEKILIERLEVAEKQLREASEAMNHSVGGQSLSTEFAELHSQNVDLLKEKQSLETELSRSRAEVQEATGRYQSSLAKVELLQRELEEAQCSISSYARLLLSPVNSTIVLFCYITVNLKYNNNNNGHHGHQVHRQPISASSGRNELGEKNLRKNLGS